MVTSMLEKAIEIEGLLRIIRDGDPLPETYKLLSKKAEELAGLAAGLEEKVSEPQPEPPAADFVMATPATSPKISEVDFYVHEPAQEPAKEPAPKADSPAQTPEFHSELDDEEDIVERHKDLTQIEEDDIVLSFEDTTEYPFGDEHPEETPISMTPDKDNEAPKADEDTEGEEEDAESENVIEDNYYEEHADVNKTEDDSKEVKSRREQQSDLKTDWSKDVKIAPAPKRQIKLKSAFSLNDRFLYARELFDGNMKMFDSTLEFIEGIEDYSIIEDYFYSELEWDPENSEVATFMDILRPHFRE